MLAVAFGLAVTTSGLAQEQESSVPEGQPKAESGNSPAAESRNKRTEEQTRPEKLVPALEKIESAVRDLVEQKRAGQRQNPSNEEIRDLIAQEGMALWAQAMFWATLAAVGLTAVGVLLIWRTLKETKRAADYTSGMLVEAEKTTAAAQQAVAEARATNQIAKRAVIAERRPWIKFTLKPDANMDVSHSLATLPMTLTIENFGLQPAINVQKHWTIIEKNPYAPHVETNAFLVAVSERGFPAPGIVVFPGTYGESSGYQCRVKKDVTFNNAKLIFCIVYKGLDGEEAFYTAETFDILVDKKTNIFDLRRIDTAQKVT